VKVAWLTRPLGRITTGLQEGCSQVAKRSDDGRHVFVWNFPIDVTFKSASPFGWSVTVVSICSVGVAYQ
jgi:B9 domain-containing protein 1